MADMIITFLFITLLSAVAFGLTALVVVTIANAKAARQGREKRKPPPQHSDTADFKRGV